MITPLQRILSTDNPVDLFTTAIATLMDRDHVTLGNVDFHVDRTGPWPDEFCYSLPVRQWRGVHEALQNRLKQLFTPRQLEQILLHWEMVQDAEQAMGRTP